MKIKRFKIDLYSTHRLIPKIDLTNVTAPLYSYGKRLRNKPRTIKYKLLKNTKFGLGYKK